MQTFDHSAPYYDDIYAARGKNYEIEAEILWSHVLALWTEEGPPRALLDVACGTGEHLRWLASRVNAATGTDASAAMLEVARTKLPHLEFTQQSMEDLDLGVSFDAITCLFAAIAYVDDEAAMRRSIQRMADHLSPFGVLAIEPGVRPETVKPPETSSMAIRRDGTTIERITSGTLDRDAGLLNISFQYRIVADDGAESRAFEELHPIRLFSDATYRSALSDAGLTDIRFDERGLSGTGLYTARRTP